MKQRTIVQVPMSPQLRESAEKASFELGFSSLQETIRVFLGRLSKKEITISLQNAEEKLSPKAIRRYNRIAKEIGEGKGIYRPKNDKEFFEMLNS